MWTEENRNFIDPGQTSSRVSYPAAMQWGMDRDTAPQQMDSAIKAYLNWRLGSGKPDEYYTSTPEQQFQWDVANPGQWAQNPTGGFVKPWSGGLKAYHNQTGQPVGSLAFSNNPGERPVLWNMAVDKSVRGQGYGKELIEEMEKQVGPRMGDLGIGTNITNSPGFWEKMSQRWSDLPISKAINQQLEWGRQSGYWK